MLCSRTNRIISGDAPNIYLERIQKRYGISPERLNVILQSHLINPVLLRNNDFDAFYKARTEMLLSLIEKSTGKPISRLETLTETQVAEAAVADEIEEEESYEIPEAVAQ